MNTSENKVRVRYLYDTTWDEEPCLRKFVPVETLKWYTGWKFDGCIFRNFEEAKQSVVDALQARIDDLENELDEVLKTTEETCEIGNDPYFH